ncbi:hypothetical protein F5Y19DRAFT_484886 [Xylariaceae sp. FL1651]|nr:hypothetical protein F5Y19DRAFT_484886 [Xylariaceae sp. FL1651]
MSGFSFLATRDFFHVCLSWKDLNPISLQNCRYGLVIGMIADNQLSKEPEIAPSVASTCAELTCKTNGTNAPSQRHVFNYQKYGNATLDWQGTSPSQKEKVMQQVVDVFLEIEKHPFDAMGSILPSRDLTGFEVKGFAHHAMYRVGNEGALGPFHSSQEAAVAIIRLYLAMMASGEIGAAYPINVFLVHRFRLDLLNNMEKDASLGERFFLKHPDDKGDHILVNKAFNIVGIIDWDWCQTVSKKEAFSSPYMIWPVAKFYDGSNDLADEELRLAMIFRERGRSDLAKCIIEARKIQRFFFAAGPGSGSHNDRKTLIDHFMGIKRAFDHDEEGWEEWSTKALEKWKSDELLQVLLQSNT